MRKMKDSGIEWIGEIPVSWDVSKSKYFYSCLDGKRVPLDASQRNPGKYPYWGAGSIMDYIDSYIFDEEIVLLGEDGAPFFDKNRPVSFVVNEKVWVNNHIHVLKPNPDLNARFMMYFLNTVDYGSYINGSILNKLTQSSMDNIAFVKVPLEEQTRIADYLDKKCSEIDALIASKEKTNELLKERRQSIIYEAVTKGLNPDVPMKDSGIEWIGEIPESSQIIRLKYLCKIFGRIGFRGYTQADLVVEGEGPITLSPSNISEHGMDYSKCTYLTWEKYDESPEIQIHNNDILLVKTGSSYGKSAIVADLPMEATINPQFVAIKEIVCNPKFLYYAMQTKIFEYQVEQAVVGGTIPTMAQEKINNFCIVLHSADECEKTVTYLDTMSTKFDALISANESTIQKLKEYRQSIIYEAVTGKIEI